MNYDNEDPLGGGESLHDLTLGDVCTVTSGKHIGKTVLVIKAGIQTKFGLRAITVEWHDSGDAGSEKVWAAPEELSFTNRQDIPTAERIKEADYQEWKARKNAGVPPAGQFTKKKNWSKDKRPTDTGY
jgi:hypothetical protein